MHQRLFPTWLAPMAATLTRERFAGPDWIFERKLDGIRLLAFKGVTREST
jgi:ATP-dependent DNA ligase